MTHKYHNLQQRKGYTKLLRGVLICFLNLKAKFLPHTFESSFCHLWVQTEKSSDLLFRVAPDGLKMMLYFSFRQRLHFLVLGLNFLPLSIIFQLMLKFVFSSFNFHMYVERVVFESARFLKLLVWPSYRFLKVFPVNPVYVLVVPFCSTTVA